MYGKPLPVVDQAGRPAATHQKDARFEYLTTRIDDLAGWARKFSLFPYPFVTACCAMEFMAVGDLICRNFKTLRDRSCWATSEVGRVQSFKPKV